MTDDIFRTHLTNRMLGVLFVLTCLLSQAGTASAGVGTVAVYGP